MTRTALKRVYSAARWLVELEIGIWRSLFLLVTRRVPGKGPGVQAFSYAKDVSPVLGAFIFVSVLELPVVHLLVPWETVRLAADVLGVWGLLWMVGYLASMRVFPHLLDAHGIRVRQGTSVDVRIPWGAVESVTSTRSSIPTNRSVQVEDGDRGAVVYVAMMKQARVRVVLRGPTTVVLPDRAQPIAELRLYADDPRAFVARAGELLEEYRLRNDRGEEWEHHDGTELESARPRSERHRRTEEAGRTRRAPSEGPAGLSGTARRRRGAGRRSAPGR